MVCYLQPDDIVCPLKAAKGDEVLTAFGDGKVLRYRLSDNMYEIQLKSNATLYAKAEAFDRDIDSIHDSGVGFGMKWLLGFLWSSNSQQQRSRSNSIASVASNWSQKTPGGR